MKSAHRMMDPPVLHLAMQRIAAWQA